MSDMVEMTVEGVGRLEDGSHVAVLRERGGPRTVGIEVGIAPATWISAHLAGVPVPRPSTYTLSLRVTAHLGGRLVRATIDDNGGPEPHAYVEVDGPSGLLELGCAAEDAVALAACGGVPVLVHPELLRSVRGPAGPSRAGPSERRRRSKGASGDRPEPGAAPTAGETDPPPED